MAIVMTKRGELPAERKYTGRCGTCKSEFEAKQGDLTYESDYHESYYKAACTLCGNLVYFKQVL
jgi:DNA-directed RNA polymerase subunit RPC12/RpoP